jgi:hypothetical protein
MAIDDNLPMPVVMVLNAFGIEWPYINEDEVVKFAHLVREFAIAVEQTHADASNAVKNIAQAHQGASTQTMQSGWFKAVDGIPNLTPLCHTLADGLDAWAVDIVAKKVEAIFQLGELAAEVVADPLSSPLVEGAAQAAMYLLKQGLILGVTWIVEKLAEPLFKHIEEVTKGLDWSQASGSADAATPGVVLDLEQLLGHTDALQIHAQTMRQHGENVGNGVSALSF